jgi:hypothetical protein
LKIQITTDYLVGYRRDQIVDLSLFTGTPMEQFWRDRLREDDGICKLVSETNKKKEGTD